MGQIGPWGARSSEQLWSQVTFASLGSGVGQRVFQGSPPLFTYGPRYTYGRQRPKPCLVPVPRLYCLTAQKWLPVNLFQLNYWTCAAEPRWIHSSKNFKKVSHQRHLNFECNQQKSSESVEKVANFQTFCVCQVVDKPQKFKRGCLLAAAINGNCHLVAKLQPRLFCNHTKCHHLQSVATMIPA